MCAALLTGRDSTTWTAPIDLACIRMLVSLLSYGD